MQVDYTSHKNISLFERLVKYLYSALPEGGSLPDDVWESRHRGILTLLWLHVIGIVYFGLMVGAGWPHSLLEGAVLAMIAFAASWKKTPRKFRSATASFGLITASALFVHLSGGYIEMHFHFFVMLGVIVLYQDWFPFLVAIGYVVIHHGVIGVLDPFAVYNHPDAFARPWKWAAIHGGFVLAASIANIVSWRLNEALRTYNELILNSTGEGIIGLDSRGKIAFLNPAAAKMIGYEVEEFKGQPLANLLHRTNIEGAPYAENQILTHMITPKGTAQPVNEGRFWRKNDTSFMAEYMSTPIRAGGAVVGAVVTFKDITERKQAEESLQKAKDELEIRVAERTAELKEANQRLLIELAERQQAETMAALARDQALEASRLKTELLAKVSHELRTPLGTILGFAEVLQLNLYGPLSEKQRQTMSKIIDSAHYLTSMVSELLDQAQLDAGKLQLDISAFAPCDLIEDILSKMNVLAQAKGLTLTATITADMPATLWGDSVRIQQILVNLVSNAIKFTQKGTIRVYLYQPDAMHWALQVSDTGSGIPIEAQSYIFEPFRQVDGSATRQQSGTGLGLSIVKQLTSLMDGQIFLESETGKGSTFTIQLPLKITA